MSIKDGVRWVQEHLGFINRLPSWLNELLSGFLCVALAWLLLILLGWLVSLAGIIVDLRVATFPLAFVLSEAYEHWFDPWGYSSQDVVERVRGVVVLMIAWAVMHGR